MERDFLLTQIGPWLENASIVSLALSASCGTARPADMAFAIDLLERVAQKASYKFVSEDGVTTLPYTETIQRLRTLFANLADDERLCHAAFFHGSSSMFLEITGSLRSRGRIENTAALVFRRVSALIRVGRFAEAAVELRSLSEWPL